MVLTREAGVRRSSGPGRGAWVWVIVGVAAVVGVLAVLIGALAVNGSRDEPLGSSTQGSGISVTDHREVAPFTSVELAGANTVEIHVGATSSVAISGDDNLVSRVTTDVESGRLVIDDAGSFTTTAPMRVVVSTPALEGVALGGDGTITVDGVESADFDAELAGDGTLVVSGTVEELTAALTGTGSLDLDDLTATDGAVRLEGTGTIRVHAAATLDATLTGTGAIVYSGSPAVTVHNTGTGTVASA